MDSISFTIFTTPKKGKVLKSPESRAKNAEKENVKKSYEKPAITAKEAIYSRSRVYWMLAFRIGAMCGASLVLSFLITLIIR